MEAIHVELADETGDVSMFEVVCQGVGELFPRIESKGVVFQVVICPPYQMRQLGVVEHCVQLVYKCIFLYGRVLLRFLAHEWIDGCYKILDKPCILYIWDSIFC